MNETDELQRLCAEGGSHARTKYLLSKIKRSTIAELRKLLRERGVRFNEFKFMTQWTGALGENVEAYPTDTFPDTLLVKHVCLTPEQAIDATLGRGTCRVIATKKLGDLFGYKLSCGHSMVNPFDDHPDYCPWCGRKVVSE